MDSVLVVEDEAAIREMVSYNLSREGFRVATVGSGEEALAVVELQAFDVVLLDWMLPGVDGLTVCRELRNNPKTRNIPIIMLTALSGEADVISGLKEGADDYVAKPFSPKVLVVRVQAALRRKRADY